MGQAEVVRDLVTPVLAGDGLELVDCELKPGLLRITVDRPDGIDAELLGETSRRLSRLLDEQDPIEGRYTLEVSTPGLERPLRTAEQFQRATGEVVSVRTRAGAEGERRHRGTLLKADGSGIVVAIDEGGTTVERWIAYDEIDRARTVFEWAGQPKPGSKKKKAAS